ncbi:MAG TPA: sugar ABC transporter substrate-binding protein [Clostridiales bacterium]|nr:sugar ABC transporter substrate-binding protein [Clostridiales bacterium]
MKKFLSLTLVLALILAISVGCSSSSGQSSQQASPAANAEASTAESSAAETTGEKVVLDMLWFADGAETEAMKHIIEDYQAIKPNVQVNLLEVPYDEITNKIMMSVVGGEPPALARTTESVLSAVYDATLDLREYVDDIDGVLAQFMPSIYNYFIINDKVTALPTDVTANGMIYNKTAFDKAGVQVPTSPDDVWTWDEFVAALEKVMADGGVQYGMVIDNPSHRWSSMLYQFGGKFMGQDGPAFNSPETLEALKFTKELFDKEIVPKSTWLGGEDPNNMFRSGQVAVHLSGNWMMTNYRDNIKDFEWGVTYMPKQKNRSSTPGGKQLAAFKGSGVEKEAVDFILFATSQEENAKYCVESLFLSPRLDNAKLDYPFGSEFFEIFSNELENTVDAASFDWGFPNFSGVARTPQNEGMYELIAGNITPEQHIANMEEVLQELYQ